jgi:predicted transcriptional regulator
MKLDSKESTNFTLRMPVEQRIELEKIAQKEDRTVTNLINMALKRYIEMYNGVKK